MEDNINNDQNTASNCSIKKKCKLSCKCIMTMSIIVLLLISSVYLFMEHQKQSHLIKQQAYYIEELRSDIASRSNTHRDNALLDSLFDDFFTIKRPMFDIDNFFNNKDSRLHNLSRQSYNHQSHITTRAKDNEYIITAILAGLDKDQISINLENDTLTISANNQTSAKDKNKSSNELDFDDSFNRIKDNKINNHHHKYHCSVKIPNDVDKEKITSDLKNGILTITMPRDKTKQESKKININ